MTEEMEARARAEEQLRRFDGVDPSTLADDELKSFLQLALDEGAIRGFRAAADRLLEVDKGTVADLFAMQDPDPEEVQQIKAEVLAKHGRWVDSLLTRTREYTNGLRYQQSKDEADGGDPWATVDLKAYAERMDVDPSPETAQLNADLAEILRQDEEAAADAASAGDVRLFAEVAHAQQVRELGSDVALSLPSEAELRELAGIRRTRTCSCPTGSWARRRAGAPTTARSCWRAAAPVALLHFDELRRPDARDAPEWRRRRAAASCGGPADAGAARRRGRHHRVVACGARPAHGGEPPVGACGGLSLARSRGGRRTVVAFRRRERPRKLRRRTSAAQEAAGHVPYAQSVALVQRAVGAPGVGEGDGCLKRGPRRRAKK